MALTILIGAVICLWPQIKKILPAKPIKVDNPIDAAHLDYLEGVIKDQLDNIRIQNQVIADLKKEVVDVPEPDPVILPEIEPEPAIDIRVPEPELPQDTLPNPNEDSYDQICEELVPLYFLNYEPQHKAEMQQKKHSLMLRMKARFNYEKTSNPVETPAVENKLVPRW